MNLTSYLKIVSYGILTIFWFGSLQGGIDLDLDITNGYRRDFLSSIVKTYNPPLTPSLDPSTVGTLIAKDVLKIKDIRIYQFGFKVQWRPCHWIARFEVDLGISRQTRYSDIFTNIGSPKSTVLAFTHNGHTRDYNAGFGYIFHFNRCRNLGIGLMGGWSYHSQRYHDKDLIQDGKPNPKNNLKFFNQWQGPWLGVDAEIYFYRFDLHVGYEYHWADWRGRWELASAPNIVRSAYSESPHARGAIFYFVGIWNFCPYLNVGVGFKMQNWRANNAINAPSANNTLTPTPSESQLMKAKHIKWTSYAATLDVGLTF